MTATDDRLLRLRRGFVRLIVGVLLVDAVGMAVFFFTGIKDDETGRKALIAVWMIATLLVVVPGLRGIRRIRREV